MSDNVVGDVLFDLVRSAELTDTLARLELTGITVRHRMQPLAKACSSHSGPCLPQ